MTDAPESETELFRQRIRKTRPGVLLVEPENGSNPAARTGQVFESQAVSAERLTRTAQSLTEGRLGKCAACGKTVRLSEGTGNRMEMACTCLSAAGV